MTKIIRNPALRAFTRWYMGHAGVLLKIPPDNAFRMLENSTEFVIYRDGQVQVELIFIREGTEVPPHRHPNVETYEIPIHGEGARARVEGKLHSHKAGERRHPVIPLAFGAVHKATTGNGLALISIQNWRGGVKPTFITDDWVGEVWR